MFLAIWHLRTLYVGLCCWPCSRAGCMFLHGRLTSQNAVYWAVLLTMFEGLWCRAVCGISEHCLLGRSSVGCAKGFRVQFVCGISELWIWWPVLTKCVSKRLGYVPRGRACLAYQSTAYLLDSVSGEFRAAGAAGADHTWHIRTLHVGHCSHGQSRSVLRATQTQHNHNDKCVQITCFIWKSVTRNKPNQKQPTLKCGNTKKQAIQKQKHKTH